MCTLSEMPVLIHKGNQIFPTTKKKSEFDESKLRSSILFSVGLAALTLMGATVHQEASLSIRCESSSHLKLAFVGILSSAAPGANSYSFSSFPFLHWALMPRYTLFLPFHSAEFLALSGPVRSL